MGAPSSAESALLALDRLAADAAGCTLCGPGVRPPVVLSRLNGNPAARLLFVAEAPGRRGAARDGVPLGHDTSGLNFRRLLAQSGIDDAAIFVTNAVLCNPLSPRGTNRRPRAGEVRNCLPWLRRQLDLVRPAVVATLGVVALEAVGRLEPHGLHLGADTVGQPHPWAGRMLVPLYHPSGQVLASRRRTWEQQAADFQRLARIVASAARPPQPAPTP